MMWDDDNLKYEKYLVFDSIVKFNEVFEGKNSASISIRELHDFIDEFFEKRDLV